MDVTAYCKLLIDVYAIKNLIINFFILINNFSRKIIKINLLQIVLYHL